MANKYIDPKDGQPEDQQLEPEEQQATDGKAIDENVEEGAGALVD